jgi:hypothetical protein
MQSIPQSVRSVNPEVLLTTTKPRSRRRQKFCDHPLTLADHKGELQRLRGKVDQHYEFIARRPNAVLDTQLLAHLNKLIDWRLNRIDKCELEEAEARLEQAEARCASLRKRIAARGEQVFGEPVFA